jgi:hypothetical protein
MALEIMPRCRSGTRSAITAVSPAVAALSPSMVADQATVTPGTVVCMLVTTTPAATASTPPPSQTRRRPKRLRERSQRAPLIGRAIRATRPEMPLTMAKSVTLDWGLMSCSCWGNSSCRGTRLAIQ